MSGFMANATGRYLAAFEFFSRAVEVLEWGRQIWNDVSVEHRGVVFELSFIRGVRRLQLSCMHEVSCKFSWLLSSRLFTPHSVLSKRSKIVPSIKMI